MSSLSDLEFQLLAVLGSKEQTGREVAQGYNKETGRTIPYGSLYSTLRRLKESEFLDSRDGQDADGRVRYFKINGNGRAAIQTARAQYKELATFGLGRSLA